MNVLNTKAAGYAAAVLVGGLVIYFIGKKLASSAGDAARAVGNAINPTSDQNLAYRGVNAVGSALTGDDAFTFGGFLYDLTHPKYDPNADAKMTPAFVPRTNQVRETANIFERLLGP